MPHLKPKALRPRFPLAPAALAACALIHGGALAQAADAAEPAAAAQGQPDAARGHPAGGAHAAAHFRRRRRHPRHAGPRDGDRRPCATAPRRHRDPRRPAGVLRARRPGQGARQRAHQPRRQRLRGPVAGAEGRIVRRLLQPAALPLLRNDAYGEADRVDFIDDKRSIIRNATYTTCQRQPGPELDARLDPARRKHPHRRGRGSRPGPAARAAASWACRCCPCRR